MRRLFVLILLLLMAPAALLAGCTPSDSYSQPRPVIAVLLSDDIRMPKVEGLRAGLEALGYPEESITLQVYSAAGDRSALPGLAQKAVASNPALIVAGGGIEAMTLRQLERNSVPVVLMGVASTARWGLIESFARPGGIFTGLDNQHAELSAKRLEFLVKLLPGVQRVLLIYDPLVIPGHHGLEVTEEAARRLGVSISRFPVSSPEQALADLHTLQPDRYDAVLLLPAFVLESAAREITAELQRLRLPVMGPLDLEGQAGLLAAYGVSMREQGVQSARFVAKILQGKQPGMIPVETPDNPVLVVDQRVARQLGVTLSPVGMAFAKVREEVGEP